MIRYPCIAHVFAAMFDWWKNKPCENFQMHKNSLCEFDYKLDKDEFYLCKCI